MNKKRAPNRADSFWTIPRLTLECRCVYDHGKDCVRNVAIEDKAISFIIIVRITYNELFVLSNKL